MKSNTERTIRTTREHPLGCGCLTKLILSFGLYFFIWLARKLVITDKRVIFSSGVFSRSEKTIPLNRVTDVSIKSSLTGRMLNYGDILIESAGSGREIVAKGMSEPTAIRDIIVEQQAV